MRGATCMEMHREALRSCLAAGIRATSNVYLARELGMRPVGTAGHEHQQRWGSDIEAFRALRDMRPGMPSFLFDTFDADKGITDAVVAAREVDWPDEPRRRSSVRFDSGDRDAQLASLAWKDGNSRLGLTYVFMDSITPKAVEHFEALAEGYNIPSGLRVYGAGGFLVGSPARTEYTRDRVSAVYKLCQTGGRPTMKFSTEAKQSIPGEPVIFRKIKGSSSEFSGLIGQSGEEAPAGFCRLTEAEPRDLDGKIGYSPQTAEIIASLRERKG